MPAPKSVRRRALLRLLSGVVLANLATGLIAAAATEFGQPLEARATADLPSIGWCRLPQ